MDKLSNSRQQALLRLLRISRSRSAQAVTYAAALLGLASLVPSLQLPPEVLALAGTLGIEAMGNLLDRASSDEISDEELREKLEEIVADLEINRLLTKDEFNHAVAHLLTKNRSLALQNDEIARVLRQLESLIDSTLSAESKKVASALSIVQTKRDTVVVEVVSLVTGTVIEVEVALDIQVGYFAEQIAGHLGLPRTIENRWVIRYQLYSKTQQRTLLNHLTLRQSKVSDREVMSIHMHSPGG